MTSQARARIVFDLDGTLIDSAADIMAVANKVLAAEGAEPINLHQTRDFIGNGTDVFVQKMRAARRLPDQSQARLLSMFLGLYDRSTEQARPYSGVPEMLRTLSDAGYRLGVCTNKPISACRAVLAHLELGGFFEVLIGGDSLSVNKPDPAPLHAAFEALGDGPKLYVGDSEVDAETAERASVPFLIFSGGYHKKPIASLTHRAVFDDFAGFPALVEDTLAVAP